MSHLPQRPELKAWYKALNDYEYRANSPDAFHRALLDGVKALLSGGVIDWDHVRNSKSWLIRRMPGPCWKPKPI
ncbi:hypothetical protein SB725_15765 [Pseudomonas sp. SIMBA_041]|uniref:hypothetical protein n=1 Tax=Pseudomonas sp. SIMBA_041 TaxID=3085782 RepID=UPI003979C915